MNNEMVQVRDAEVVAAEINTIKEQTRKIMLASSVEIGRRLQEAKELVPHGNWTDWLKEKVDYSQSTADNLMRIAREYGDEQVNLFSGEAKSQTFRNLTYSQAVALFALPEEDRDEFVKENNVEDMTARQLQEAIKARQQAEADKKKAEESAADKAVQINSLNAKIDRVCLDADKKAEENESLKKSVKDAAEEIESLKTQLENSKPAGPSPEELKKLQAEAEEKIKAAYEEKASQLSLDKDTAEKAAEKAKQELAKVKREYAAKIKDAAAEKEKAEKKLAVTTPEVEKFSVYFENLQVNINSMKALIRQAGENVPETAGKLRAALKKLLDGYSQSLSNEK